MTTYIVYSRDGIWIAQTTSYTNAQSIARTAGGWIEDEDNPGVVLDEEE